MAETEESMYHEYLTEAAAARREELLRQARSRYRARERGRRPARRWLLLRSRLARPRENPTGAAMPAAVLREG
jgi:hypothetical protein